MTCCAIGSHVFSEGNGYGTAAVVRIATKVKKDCVFTVVFLFDAVLELDNSTTLQKWRTDSNQKLIEKFKISKKQWIIYLFHYAKKSATV